MQIKLVGSKAVAARVGLLVLPVGKGAGRSGELAEVDRKLGGRLLREARQQGFRGEADERFVFQTHGKLPAAHVLLYGCGNGTDGAPLAYQLADAVVRTARDTHASSCQVMLGGFTGDAVQRLAEGVRLATYRFEKYRSKPRPDALRLVVLGLPRDRDANDALARAEAFAAAAALARDLVNTPAADLPPSALADAAAGLEGLEVNVHDRAGVAALGMGALLGVAQGSQYEPRFVEMVYRPSAPARRTIALIGKGITFDSGGLNLKTAEGMRSQKRDMAGAALVIGAMSALPRLQPPVEVRGYVPSAENMPSGTAIRPGDVVRACNGKTIEILNTDAEGRLILADALAYAATKKPDLLLDFATLTAAVNTALGSRCAAVMGTDRELVAALIEAGRRCHERLWELPLIDDYRRDIDSQIADLKNMGEGQAGTIIGGLFLREFAAGLPWAHVDFSSTAFSSGHPCHPQGASGFGVRTVLHYLTSIA